MGMYGRGRAAIIGVDIILVANFSSRGDITFPADVRQFREAGFPKRIRLAVGQFAAQSTGLRRRLRQKRSRARKGVANGDEPG